MIGEDVGLGADWSRMGGIEPRICAGHACSPRLDSPSTWGPLLLCPYGNPSMHAGDEAVSGPAGVSGYGLSRFDFDVMDRASFIR